MIILNKILSILGGRKRTWERERRRSDLHWWNYLFGVAIIVVLESCLLVVSGLGGLLAVLLLVVVWSG